MTADILIADDDVINLRFLRTMLTKEGYKVRPVVSGELCIQAAVQRPPDLIILDVMMPHVNGYETCRRLKAIDALADIPVIFITALNEAKDTVKGFRAGAVDFITKPFNPDVVLIRVKTHLKLRQQQLELQRLYEEERRTYETLSELKDDLITALSHDLRNPLSNINLYAHLLAEKIACPDTQSSHYLDRITAQATRMETLIADVLDIARMGTGMGLTLKPTDSHAIVTRAAANQRAYADEQGVTLNLAHEPGTPATILADGIQFQRVLDNLIQNAIKYTDAGGFVTISLDADDDVRITVQDTGVGIPADELPHVFDKFFRASTSEGREGTGLGLALVEQIVEHHNGTIEVQSTEGEGTRFTIRLAAVTAEAVSAAAGS